MEYQRRIIDKLVRDEFIPNLIFHGPQCSGKKTMMKYLINQLYPDNALCIDNNTLYINILKDCSITSIRQKLKLFIIVEPIFCDDINHGIKLIIFDMIEYINIEIQYALRRIIEDHSNKIIFLFITNNINSVIKSIQSRCMNIPFSSYRDDNVIDDISNRVVKIGELKSMSREDIYEMVNSTMFLDISIDKNLEYLSKNVFEYSSLENKKKVDIISLITEVYSKIINKGDVVVNMCYLYLCIQEKLLCN